MNPVDVAVVIVSYRSAQLAVECLRSIAAERKVSELTIRAVVVDNASGDAAVLSAAVAENGWDWVEVLAAPTNGGFGAGNNFALRHLYGGRPPEYFHLLNPDTLLRPGAIDELVRFLENHPEVGIAGSSFENADGSSWPIAFRFPSLLGEIEIGCHFGLVTRVLRPWVVAREMTPVAQATDWVSGASFMLRRRVLDTIGGFDEHYFLYFEEIDLCLRARRAGFPTWYVPASRVMHIAGQSTGLTERGAALKRLPRYWYESRRRFFAMAFGHRRAMLIDLCAIAAHAFGLSKRFILGRMHTGVPCLIRDLLAVSLLRRENRELPAPRCFHPQMARDVQ